MTTPSYPSRWTTSTTLCVSGKSPGKSVYEGTAATPCFTSSSAKRSSGRGEKPLRLQLGNDPRADLLRHLLSRDRFRGPGPDEASLLARAPQIGLVPRPTHGSQQNRARSE